MPNWVNSRIKVSGDIKRFAAALHTAGGAPDDQRFPHRKYLGRFCDTSVVVADDEIKIYFDTAWGPADRWVGHASQEWPEAEFELAYCEQGMGFYGVLTRKGALSEEILFDQGSTKTVRCDGNERTVDVADAEPFWDRSNEDEDDDWPPNQHVTDHIEKYEIGLGG